MAGVCDITSPEYDAIACAVLQGQLGGTPSGPKPSPAIPPQYQYPDTMVGRAIPGTGQPSVNPGSLTIDPNTGLLVFWNGTSFSLAPEYLQKAFGGLGGGGGGADNALGYAQLEQSKLEFMESIRQFNEELKLQGINMGLDSEASRQQALAGLIANRNNTAVDVGNLSNNVAKTIADYAANPRDAVAELMYRNQVGGSTPFGDMTNNNFGEYGKALAAKAESIFQPVSNDLNQARLYRDSIPPVEFFGADTRGQLGLPPTPAQSLAGGVSMQPVGAGTPPPAAVSNPLQAMTDRLKAMSPEEQNAFQRYTTIASGHGWQAPPPIGQAGGGKLNLDNLFNSVDKPGESPIDSEGGLNINLNERAVLVTESGRPLAIFGERRPDGTIRREQIITKPLKSEVEKDKKLQEANKAIVETKKQTLAAFAGGGTATVNGGMPSPDDFMAQLSQYLGTLGGSGGGTGGYSTPLPSARLLAGDPWSALEEDPDAMDYTLAGYSALGISPRNLQATIKKFTPTSAQRVGQTAVRTTF